MSNALSHMKCINFADDSNLFISGPNFTDLERLTNNDLMRLAKWLCTNRLTLNVSKTHYQIYHHTRDPSPLNFSLNIQGQGISRDPFVKFLGVWVDEKLNWQHHINHVSLKISKSLGILSKTRSFLPQKHKLLLYNALILPHLNYSNIVWANNYKSNLTHLYLLQKRAVRIITNQPRLAHSEPLFEQTKILTIYNLAKLSTLIFVYKYLKNLLPPIFDNLFTLKNESRYPLRQSCPLHVPHTNKNYRKFAISLCGPILWNKFCANIDVPSTSLASFKKEVKTILFASSA